jgi:hypothetical protein
MEQEHRDLGLEVVDIDAVNELLHHTIENVPIINAAARGSHSHSKTQISFKSCLQA